MAPREGTIPGFQGQLELAYVIKSKLHIFDPHIAQICAVVNRNRNIDRHRNVTNSNYHLKNLTVSSYRQKTENCLQLI